MRAASTCGAGSDAADFVAGHAGVPGPPEDGDGDHGVDEARAEGRDHGERDQRRGQDEEELDHALQQRIDPATDHAGEDADHRADDERDADDGEPRQPGVANAEDDAREQVAADLVGAEPVGRIGRQVGGGDAQHWVVGRKERTEDGDEGDDEHASKADALEPADTAEPGEGGEGGRGEFGCEGHAESRFSSRGAARRRPAFSCRAPRGEEMTWSGSPISTRWPFSSTAMRSAISRAAARSWVTNSMAMPMLRRRLPRRFSVCAASDTSMALIGSSQSSSFGRDDHGARNGDALALAAGEFAGQGVLQRRIDTDELQGIGDLPVLLVPAETERAEPVADLLADGEPGRQRRDRILEHHLRGIPPNHETSPVVGGEQASGDAEQGGFARAAFAHERDALALLDAEVDAGEHLGLAGRAQQAALRAEALLDAVELECVGFTCHSFGPGRRFADAGEQVRHPVGLKARDLPSILPAHEVGPALGTFGLGEGAAGDVVAVRTVGASPELLRGERAELTAAVGIEIEARAESRPAE